ncbi:MAG: ABC transporter permease [Candidatus Competibacteraceae bacterium]|nr:ABC transporter permease [Candidatus Competibacteraceae bacterium]
MSVIGSRLKGVPPWLQQLAQLAPLTHIIDAARAIMIDGAGLAAISGHLLALTAMSVAFMMVGAWLFRVETAGATGPPTA